jgi:hypothetical protein
MTGKLEEEEPALPGSSGYSESSPTYWWGLKTSVFNLAIPVGLLVVCFGFSLHFPDD